MIGSDLIYTYKLLQLLSCIYTIHLFFRSSSEASKVSELKSGDMGCAHPTGRQNPYEQVTPHNRVPGESTYVPARDGHRPATPGLQVPYRPGSLGNERKPYHPHPTSHVTYPPATPYVAPYQQPPMQRPPPEYSLQVQEYAPQAQGYRSQSRMNSSQAQGHGFPAQGYGSPVQGYGFPTPGYGVSTQGYGTPVHGYGAPAHGYGSALPGR